MAQTWKTLRVFISSTFRDMHAERDHLVRMVFPELKARCRTKRLHLIDVDLRWGVSEEDADSGKALDICLDEIDSCRPYFLGLMAHRYGWIPPGRQLSITAEEIYHGVLHGNVPRQVVDLRKIIEDKLEGKSLSNEQKNTLAHCYRWDPEKGKYLLKDGATTEEERVICSVFERYGSYQRDRSFFFFRSQRLSRDLAQENADDFFEQDAVKQKNLEALKTEIVAAALPCFEYHDLETFGQMVLDILWKRIQAEAEIPAEEKDWLQQEAEFHEQFMADRTRRFVGRADLLDRMHRFCSSDEQPPLLLITGEPGSGKSALMARFAEELLRAHPEWVIVPHFIGASPASTNLREMLLRICTHLERAIGANEDVLQDIKKLFPDLLGQVAEQRKVVLILDAVNQLEKADKALSMLWLPQQLAKNVRCIISTLPGQTQDAIISRRFKPQIETVTGLTSSEISELVRTYLREIRHEFPNRQVEQDFYRKVDRGNPLYILVALEELRIFGKFEELAARIEKLPDNVSDLFDQVLERIEGDFNQPLVCDCMTTIACGRHGMTAEELQTLLKHHAPHIDPNVEPVKLPDLLWNRLYRSFSSYLFERSGVIDFFHGQLKEAVGHRYLQNEADRETVHRVIADYFEKRWAEPYSRALDELPHQRLKSKNWDELERILCNLKFIEEKCAAGMTYDLVAEYDDLEAGNKPDAPILTAWLHKHRYAVRCPFCLAWSPVQENELGKTTDCRECGRSLRLNPFIIPGEWETFPEERKAVSKDKVPEAQFGNSLSEFADFVRRHGHILSSRPWETFQLAGNQPDHTAPAVLAKEAWDNKLERRPWFHWVNKPQHRDPCLLTMSGDGHSVAACAFSMDGLRIVSGSFGGTLKICDANTGRTLTTLVGHSAWVNACAFSPDGRRVLSGSGDGTHKVWDAETGECLLTLFGTWERAAGSTIDLTDPRGCAFSPFGDRVVCCYSQNSLKLWNPHTGEELGTLVGHSAPATGCAFSPDGKRIFSSSIDGTVKLWNAETAELLLSHHWGVSAFALSPDGKQIVCGKDVLGIYDLHTRRQMTRMEYSGLITACEWSPDGKRIASSHKGYCMLWDSETGVQTSGLNPASHWNWTACAFSPDAQRIVTASDVLQIWDVEALEKRMPRPGHSSSVLACGYSPGGERAVSSSEDDIKAWDALMGKELSSLKVRASPIGACSCSSDRSRMVASVQALPDDGTEELETLTQEIGSTRSMRPVLTVDRESEVIDRLEMTPSGPRLWNKDTGEQIAELSPTYSLTGSGPPINCYAFSPDGRRAVTAFRERGCNIWDSETGMFLIALSGHKTLVSACTYSPDGWRVLTSSHDRTLKIWDPETGNCVMTLAGHKDQVNACAYSPDGRRIVSVSGGDEKQRDSRLFFWDAKTGSELASIGRRWEPAHACRFSPDGSSIIYVSYFGKSLRIWDLRKALNTATFFTDFNLTCAALARGGYSLALGDSSGRMYLLELTQRVYGTPLVTLVRVYRFRTHEYDKAATAKCEWCGRRFVPEKTVLDAIDSIIRITNLEVGASPCLELPEQAWNEPQLSSECTLCRKPLKFNPFIVDNRDRY